MDSKYCETCERVTGHKRALGVGTIIMLVITLGLWLVAIPFYPVRCSVCGRGSDTFGDFSALTVILGVVFVTLLIWAFSGGF